MLPKELLYCNGCLIPRLGGGRVFQGPATVESILDDDLIEGQRRQSGEVSSLALKRSPKTVSRAPANDRTSDGAIVKWFADSTAWGSRSMAASFLGWTATIKTFSADSGMGH